MNKAKQIFKRIGFSDVVIPIDADDNIVSTESYHIGYEDEEGNECEKDGTYLNQL